MEIPTLDERLSILGRHLRKDGYDFITPTPATHARVLARKENSSSILRDVFGWNRPFLPDQLPGQYRAFLGDDDLFEAGEKFRARVRFTRLDKLLLAHSAYPTVGADAVFFGPDTYRFCQALRALSEREPHFRPHSCVDIGAGTGAGGLLSASLFPSLQEIALVDINAQSLPFSRANAALNGIHIARSIRSDILQAWDRPADLIISNPPYLVDSAIRAYRHGGGDWGATLSVRILDQALRHLRTDGHLLLYTGSAIVDGRDKFLEEAEPILRARTVRYRYEQLDPDVFGEELEKAPYDRADRIAIMVLDVKGSDLKQ